jgi:hypothetical protein
VQTNPEIVVQNQLNAYNAKDLEALIAIYSPDACQYEHPDKLLARGSAEIRERFAARFNEPDLHAQLLNRTVLGNKVVDYERITRNFPEGKGFIELVAIYEVELGQISNAWFMFDKKTEPGN